MLKVENLCFGYNKDPILKEINFTVKKGQFTCLLGANGSGKTTILKCLNGILKPEAGAISLDQCRLEDMSQKGIARKICLVPQEHSSVFSYQSIEVVVMGITPYLGFGAQPSAEVYKRAESILEKLNALDLAYRKYNNLSGGEKQLVLIARALMQDTDYIIMDEPTSHLDFKNKHLILMELKNMAHKGYGVITALHDPNLALKFCDQVIIIKDGEVLEKGPTMNTITDQNLGRAYDINIEVNHSRRGIEIGL